MRHTSTAEKKCNIICIFKEKSRYLWHLWAHVRLLWLPWSFVYCGFVVVLRLCTVCTPVSDQVQRPSQAPVTHTPPPHTHPYPYIPDGQITEHRKTICNRGSITYKRRHPTLQGQECFRSLFSICLSLTLTRNQLRPLVAHRSSKEALLFLTEDLSAIADDLTPPLIRLVTSLFLSLFFRAC